MYIPLSLTAAMSPTMPTPPPTPCTVFRPADEDVTVVTPADEDVRSAQVHKKRRLQFHTAAGMLGRPVAMRMYYVTDP